jgi:hypothetical protein
MNTISKKIMSLHAQTAPETKARLDAQRRTSTITSLIIALLTMVLIGVILLIIAMNTDQQNIPRFEAYLGHCETAQSEEFGETVLSAIIYLVDKAMKNNGKLATDLKDDHWCYEHAIATYALAEAYTLCTKSFGENINQLEEAVQASGQFLINSQHSGGGWDYGHYYAVQCMINNGGPEWERYNKLFRDQLLNNQAKNGSFKPLNKGNQKTIKAVAASFTGDTPFATHYRTCLATLMLESYYRFLPASQGK